MTSLFLRYFPNNMQWITSDQKIPLDKTKEALMSGDSTGVNR